MFGREIGDDAEKYVRNDHVRSLMMCPGDANATSVLFRMLEFAKPGNRLDLNDAGHARCCSCGNKQGKLINSWFRTMRLFALSHGAASVRVTDWMCGYCNHVVYFTSQWLGIFPVRKGSAFTVEIRNAYLQGICYRELSMRNSLL